MAGIGHRGFMGRKKGRDCSSYLPGLYTVDEINQMVFVDGYIPVASADDVLRIEATGDYTMGIGTCWEGIYTVGVDKKYVQVLAIDFTSSAFGGICSNGLDPFTGIFDGNQLPLSNYTLSSTTTYAGFFIRVGGDAQFRHIRFVNGSFSSTATGDKMCAVGIGEFNGGDLIIDDCALFGCSLSSINGGYVRASLLLGLVTVGNSVSISNCSINSCDLDVGTYSSNYTNYYGTGVFCGASITIPITVSNCTIDAACYIKMDGALSGMLVGNCQNITFRDCLIETDFNATVVPLNSNAHGGLAGYLRGASSGINEITRCVMNGNVAGRFGTGGLIGFLSDGGTGTTVITECHFNGQITGNDGDGYGRFVGDSRRNLTIIDCYAFGDINVGALSGNSRVGGAIGRVQSSAATLTNCYVAGDNVGTGSAVNAWIGTGTCTVNDCYYDSDLSSVAGSFAVGKTTSELQTPTSNTGIYAAWTIPPWAFGTATDYPSLTTIP